MTRSGRTVDAQAGLLAVLCAADFLVVLDGLIVAVALPAISTDFGISTGRLQWVMTAYLLCFGGLLLLGGRLGDLYGRRRVLTAGLLVFSAGSLLAGLAPSSLALFGGRAIQGAGAALMAPCALALLTANFAAGPARDRALGLWSAAGSVGIPTGALLGGVLTTSLGWRWVLLINVPAAALAAYGTHRVVPESRDTTAARRLDVPGAPLVTIGTALFVLGITQVEHLASGAGVLGVTIPMTVGLVALAGFVVVERRSAAPLVPWSQLNRPGRLPASLAGAALPVGLGAVLFIGTLYLQQVLHFSALQTGLAYLALAVPVIAISPFAAVLVDRLGNRATAAIGFALQAGGLALLARVPVDGGLLIDVLPAFVLVGLGAPLAFVPVAAAAMGGAGDDSGLISGVFNTAQQVGNALALAVIATLTATRTEAVSTAGTQGSDALAAGQSAGLLMGAGIATAAAMLTIKLNTPRHDASR